MPGYFHPCPRPLTPPPLQSLYYWSVFAVGFVTRPLGAVMFGHIADTSSRRLALLLSIVTMAAPTVRGGKG